ncbi:Imm9 family immunity protein [Cephaloticoccus capnophilus]|uniref:Imm9 family immunity protein n=1 Tax=Cephaloticoccus capnophilus TaxID=1548208 RepID=UPI0009EEEE6F|nr:Imm9 family immunity protein [Cephaloticoccus capnophilus]
MKDKKDKQVKVTKYIGVPGLLGFADVFSINKKIATYTKSILPRINMEDLSGWRLSFNIGYRCTDFISIYKKFLRYPSDREYVISFSIPIPDSTQAPYGMPPAGDGRIGFFHPGQSRHSHLLDPEYHQYDNLDQYILAAAIKAIDLCFTKGFTCYGKKIKFQDL